MKKIFLIVVGKNKNDKVSELHLKNIINQSDFFKINSSEF